MTVSVLCLVGALVTIPVPLRSIVSEFAQVSAYVVAAAAGFQGEQTGGNRPGDKGLVVVHLLLRKLGYR